MMMWDTIIIGSGISGSFIANELTQQGLRVLILEAGQAYSPKTYPRHEFDINTQLFWNGAAEFDNASKIAILRPKVVGGGSVINGGLLDKFDDLAWEDFQEKSQISYFNSQHMQPYYHKALNKIHTETISEDFANQNAKIFKNGLESQGYKVGSLLRAQKNCQYSDGNDCIECLGGCRIGSKQSMMDSVLGQSFKTKNASLYSGFHVDKIEEKNHCVIVHGHNHLKHKESFTAPKIILASGSLGNTKILKNSFLEKSIPLVGKRFYNHPQWMTLARYSQPIQSFKGPLQTYKSDDPVFRKKGFKLENVFAGPVALSMIIPEQGRKHTEWMRNLSHTACIEVAIRDSEPGEIQVSHGKIHISKKLNQQDLHKRDEGFQVIDHIYEESGCIEHIKSDFAISLHLMGGCSIGMDPRHSVINDSFQMHHHPNIYCADSSIFPSAPGINPSLSIMALSIKAAESIIGSFQ